MFMELIFYESLLVFEYSGNLHLCFAMYGLWTSKFSHVEIGWKLKYKDEIHFRCLTHIYEVFFVEEL